jgi:hypothetical protein
VLLNRLDSVWVPATTAAELQLSVSTVSNHLAHVYAKFGVASRAELAALLTAGGGGIDVAAGAHARLNM